jgi:hypothetical protein
MPEPWLRGIQLDIDPALAQILFSLQQVREDLSSISAEHVSAEVPGIPTLSFQLAHIAGSLDRLTTYLEGGELSEAQLAFLKAESTPGSSLTELMEHVEASLQRAEKSIRGLRPSTFADPRFVGRRRIPTTVIGLAIHIAEHTQRHCGQAITTSRLLQAALR